MNSLSIYIEPLTDSGEKLGSFIFRNTLEKEAHEIDSAELSSNAIELVDQIDSVLKIPLEELNELAEEISIRYRL